MVEKLYSLHQFILTAKGMPKYRHLSRVTYAGFANLMKQKDMQYVLEPHRYVKALDAYIHKTY